MKRYLTKEDSKKLIELGVKPEQSSYIIWKPISDYKDTPSVFNKEKLTLKPFRPAIMGFETFECHDIFSLEDILDILPNSFNDNLLIMRHTTDGWSVCYQNVKNTTHIKEELIDALYELCIQIENNNKI